jgi:hypothetical protein
LFTDASWFTLSMNKNRQNGWQNPHTFHEVPLHNIKVGVWYGVSAHRTIGIIFFWRNKCPPVCSITVKPNYNVMKGTEYLALL